MIILNAQQLQRMAEALMRLERMLEAEGGDASHVEEGLHDVASRLGVHLEIARLATPGTLVEVVSPGRDRDSGKLWAVAEVLYLDGVLALAEGEDAAFTDRMAKARVLYRALDPGLSLPEGTPGPAQRLQTIEELLDPA